MPRRSFKKRGWGGRKRRSFKKSRAARIARARRRGRRNQTRLLRGPINRTAVAKLKYSDFTSFVPAAGACINYVFSCNGMYDPNTTGTGHQPMGFDELMTNYEHYTVIGSKITVTFVGGTEDYLCALATDGESGNALAGVGVAPEIKERQRTRWKYVPSNTGGPAKAVLSLKYSTKKFFHEKSIVGNSKYQGTASSNPSELAYYYLYAGSNDGSNTVGTIKADVLIEYLAVFTEPKTIGQS